MKIIRAKQMGYCMGVDRAVKMAEDGLQNGTIYALGALIHNKAELNRLEKMGLQVLEDDQLPPSGSVALIRAHGVSPTDRKKLLDHQIELIDATCPLVVKNQKIVSTKAEEGYFIVIAGKADHPEIKALSGFCGQNYTLIGSVEQARQLHLPQSKVLLIAQTTLEPKIFTEIEAILKQKHSELESPTSICPATQARQLALTNLASQCEAVVVVGDRKSANTIGLVHRIEVLGKPAFLVEAVENLPSELKNYQTLGLTAGASAPAWLIDKIEQAILSF